MVPGGEDDIRGWLTSRIGSGMRLGLSSCEQMLERLGNPQRSFPSVHVAGTNGKGSLCAHLSSMGSGNGLRIGLFTSPHLITVEERIRIDGRPLEAQKLDHYISEIRKASSEDPEIKPTYFEVTFLASMLAFADAEVDRAVIETGMGGRLDSTRLVEADVCAITSISLDHTEVLGESLTEIATEKAGIYRKDTPMLCLHHPDSGVRKAIEDVGGSDVHWVNPISNSAQGIAKELAMRVGGVLGWESMVSEVRWPGRTDELFQWSGVGCRMSAAHNEESISHDLSSVSDIPHVLVIGMTAKSSIESTLRPLADLDSATHVFTTDAAGGRLSPTPASSLAEIVARITHFEVEAVTDPIIAMDKAADLAAKKEYPLLAIGSIHLVGKIQEELIRRENLDLWDELTIHSPLSEE